MMVIEIRYPYLILILIKVQVFKDLVGIMLDGNASG